MCIVDECFICKSFITQVPLEYLQTKFWLEADQRDIGWESFYEMHSGKNAHQDCLEGSDIWEVENE